MKLSDIKGERTFDVLADIVSPIASIAQDEDAASLFTPQPIPEGMTPTQVFLERVKRSFPPLLKAHRGDFAAIMAAIEGTTPKEYMEGISLAKLLHDIIQLLNDEEFASFFE